MNTRDTKDLLYELAKFKNDSGDAFYTKNMFSDTYDVSESMTVGDSDTTNISLKISENKPSVVVSDGDLETVISAGKVSIKSESGTFDVKPGELTVGTNQILNDRIESDKIIVNDLTPSAIHLPTFKDATVKSNITKVVDSNSELLLNPTDEQVATLKYISNNFITVSRTDLDSIILNNSKTQQFTLNPKLVAFVDNTTDKTFIDSSLTGNERYTYTAKYIDDNIASHITNKNPLFETVNAYGDAHELKIGNSDATSKIVIGNNSSTTTLNGVINNMKVGTMTMSGNKIESLTGNVVVEGITFNDNTMSSTAGVNINNLSVANNKITTTNSTNVIIDDINISGSSISANNGITVESVKVSGTKLSNTNGIDVNDVNIKGSEISGVSKLNNMTITGDTYSATTVSLTTKTLTASGESISLTAKSGEATNNVNITSSDTTIGSIKITDNTITSTKVDDGKNVINLGKSTKIVSNTSSDILSTSNIVASTLKLDTIDLAGQSLSATGTIHVSGSVDVVNVSGCDIKNGTIIIEDTTVNPITISSVSGGKIIGGSIDMSGKTVNISNIDVSSISGSEISANKIDLTSASSIKVSTISGGTVVATIDASGKDIDVSEINGSIISGSTISAKTINAKAATSISVNKIIDGSISANSFDATDKTIDVKTEVSGSDIIGCEITSSKINASGASVNTFTVSGITGGTIKDAIVSAGSNTITVNGNISVSAITDTQLTGGVISATGTITGKELVGDKFTSKDTTNTKSTIINNSSITSTNTDGSTSIDGGAITSKDITLSNTIKLSYGEAFTTITNSAVAQGGNNIVAFDTSGKNISIGSSNTSAITLNAPLSATNITASAITASSLTTSTIIPKTNSLVYVSGNLSANNITASALTTSAISYSSNDIISYATDKSITLGSTNTSLKTNNTLTVGTNTIISGSAISTPAITVSSISGTALTVNPLTTFNSGIKTNSITQVDDTLPLTISRSNIRQIDGRDIFTTDELVVNDITVDKIKEVDGGILSSKLSIGTPYKVNIDIASAISVSAIYSGSTKITSASQITDANRNLLKLHIDTVNASGTAITDTVFDIENIATTTESTTTYSYYTLISRETVISAINDNKYFAYNKSKELIKSASDVVELKYIKKTNYFDVLDYKINASIDREGNIIANTLTLTTMATDGINNGSIDLNGQELSANGMITVNGNIIAGTITDCSIKDGKITVSDSTNTISFAEINGGTINNGTISASGKEIDVDVIDKAIVSGGSINSGTIDIHSGTGAFSLTSVSGSKISGATISAGSKAITATKLTDCEVSGGEIDTTGTITITGNPITLTTVSNSLIDLTTNGSINLGTTGFTVSALTDVGVKSGTLTTTGAINATSATSVSVSSIDGSIIQNAKVNIGSKGITVSTLNASMTNGTLTTTGNVDATTATTVSISSITGSNVEGATINIAGKNVSPTTISNINVSGGVIESGTISASGSSTLSISTIDGSTISGTNINISGKTVSPTTVKNITVSGGTVSYGTISASGSSTTVSISSIENSTIGGATINISGKTVSPNYLSSLRLLSCEINNGTYNLESASNISISSISGSSITGGTVNIGNKSATVSELSGTTLSAVSLTMSASGEVDATSITNPITLAKVANGLIKNGSMKVNTNISVSAIDNVSFSGTTIELTNSASSEITYTSLSNIKNLNGCTIVNGNTEISGNLTAVNIEDVNLSGTLITMTADGSLSATSAISIGNVVDCNLSGGKLDIGNKTISVSNDISLVNVSGSVITGTGNIGVSGNISANDIIVGAHSLSMNDFMTQYANRQLVYAKTVYTISASDISGDVVEASAVCYSGVSQMIIELTGVERYLYNPYAVECDGNVFNMYVNTEISEYGISGLPDGAVIDTLCMYHNYFFALANRNTNTTLYYSVNGRYWQSIALNNSIALTSRVEGSAGNKVFYECELNSDKYYGRHKALLLKTTTEGTYYGLICFTQDELNMRF